MNEATTPTLKVKSEIETIPPHKLEHSRRRRAQANWQRNRIKGFIDAHTEREIDDRKIALATDRNFYELKSFGQTMDMSLSLTEIRALKAKLSHTYIEEREVMPGKVERIQVEPRHLHIWEYDPATGAKWRIE